MKSRPRRTTAATVPPTIAPIRPPLFLLLELTPSRLLLPVGAIAMLVVLLLLPVGSLELKECVTWPGQVVSLPPLMVVKLSEVAYTPWLFRQVSSTSILRVPGDGPITDGYMKWCRWWEYIDPAEGVVVGPHCYVKGWCYLDWDEGNGVRLLAADDVDSQRSACFELRQQVNDHRNRGFRPRRRWKACRGAVRRQNLEL
jgi:hypothetical protein